MKLTTTAISAICLFCSMLLFPLFFLGSMTVLFLTAAAAEMLSLLTGEASKADLSTTRTARLHHS